MKEKKNGWTLFLLILAGIVLGGFAGSLAAGVSGLDWLNYGQSFGLEEPMVLTLGFLVLTFGLTIKITIAGIFGIVLAILIYRWI
ncbi:MAG: DUF4321 domain-containing protein [Lachnospiraceae bacterium]|jgi:hypothetical protein|nr:DUF4321 domain-containing protein [Lachnospiraceae bacterium]MCI9658420.1 DUF4321 domain-containing protein [Lachnospiraceae bacterium]